MNIPKYWAKEEQEVETPGGSSIKPGRKKMQLACWGWSDRSRQEAQGKASAKLRNAMARVMSGAVPERYPYGRGPLREEIVNEIKLMNGEELALVTRNAYGALVLNAANAMFMDVDLPPEKSAAGFSKLFRRLLGREEPSAKDTETQILQRIEQWAGRQFDMTVRIYRTAAGFRCLITSHLHDPASDKAQDMMKSLECDPLYIRLCKDQGSFRARVTPKPWRINVTKPSWHWPYRDDREERESRKWQDKYTRASSAYCVCRLLKVRGGGKILSEIAPVLELHDRMCCSMESRKLA